ncbi:MAG TPA: cytochrome c family protein [Sphingomonas sp.]|nr:cytochrome c family protein [Sphingomonas sp.]
MDQRDENLPGWGEDGRRVAEGVSDRSNTIAGWVLAAGITALALSVVTGDYFRSERPETMGYHVEGVVEDAGTAAPVEKPVAFYLAKADPAKGASVFKRCQACHSDQKGGPNQIGPQLWDVVGRPVATEPGFSYSDALKKHSGPWTFAELFEWLKSPKNYAPGTKMTFAGLSDPQERADVIAYLNNQSDHPEPLPAPPKEEPAAKAGTDANAKPGKNSVGEGAKNQPVLNEAQAAKNPQSSVGGNAAPAVTGQNGKTTKK